MRQVDFPQNVALAAIPGAFQLGAVAALCSGGPRRDWPLYRQMLRMRRRDCLASYESMRVPPDHF